MSLLDKLRQDANRETNPQIRARLLAKIAEIESGAQDISRRLHAVKANRAEPRAGARGRFFSWSQFVYGLGAVAALIGSFYYELAPVASIILLGAVILAIAGVHLIVIRSRLRKLDRSA
jgi:hypothetical protein